MTVFESMTAAERTLRARCAVHTSWANTTDRRKRTANGTAAFLARFERQVDPDGVMTPQQRAQAAESAKNAYMASLALKASQSRRRKQQRTP